MITFLAIAECIDAIFFLQKMYLYLRHDYENGILLDL